MLDWTPHPILPILEDEEMATMTPDEVISYFNVREEAIVNAGKDKFRYGIKFDNWNQVMKQLETHNEALISGGNRCLHPDQEIYDPVAKVSRKVSEIDGDFHVWAYNGERRVVSHALQPFVKCQDMTYRVLLSNGQCLRVSGAHQVSTPHGWRSIKDIGIGGSVSALVASADEHDFSVRQQFSAFLPSSSSAHFLSGLRRGVLRYLRKLQDSLFGYRSCPHFYGEQPPLWRETSQGAAPSQDGAEEYTWCAFFGLDGLDSKPQYIQTCCELPRLSNPYEDVHCEDHREGVESHTFYKVLKPLRLTTFGQFLNGLCRLSLEAFYRLGRISLLRSCLGGFLECLCSCFSVVDEETIVMVYDKQSTDIWDIEVPDCGNYFIGDILQKNSGKTQFGAYLTVKAALENPNSEMFCFAQNQEVSIRQQQAAVYDWLPSEYKTKQTGSSTYISFTMKNGFTDNSLILPNKSRISFKTYSQYANNPSILEGAELGSLEPTTINLGVWLDEMLGGPEMVETLRFRLATRNSKMILTFTPIFGYTELVRQYVEKAKVLDSREAELLNGEKLATVMECADINGTVHYFWSEDNPFGGYSRIKEDLAHKTRDHILVRAYGVATKSSTTRFPRFNKAVNVIDPEMVPYKDVTRYCIIDPAGSKNWFIAWIAVDGTGTYYVYREWPDISVGDWAERKGDKIVPGPASKGLGYGIKDYVELMHELEGDEEIFERIIDPRLGAAKYQGSDGSSSIIEDLSEQDMVCLPAPGIDIEDGLQSILSKMSYNTDKPIDSVNRPHFYVTEDCENIISALGEYTGDEGLKEAYKDCIDVLRYAAVSDIDHVGNDEMGVTRQGGGGY